MDVFPSYMAFPFDWEYYKMIFFKGLLKLCNAVVSIALFALLLTAGAYSVYALWDNNQVYTAADDVQSAMQSLKPVVSDEEQVKGPSFDELLAINEDVRAWLTLDGTKIDYPIVQGENNLTYINKDVFGNFALAGSIYLDSRNNREFSDRYNLLYGHHMSESRMFGDLDLYKDQEFFEENSTGTLITPSGVYDLKIFACLLAPAGEDMIFDPTRSQTNINKLMTYVQSNAMYIRQDVMDQLSGENAPGILACTTCSSEFTDARTILLAIMIPVSQ